MPRVFIPGSFDPAAFSDAFDIGHYEGTDDITTTLPAVSSVTGAATLASQITTPLAASTTITS